MNTAFSMAPSGKKDAEGYQEINIKKSMLISLGIHLFIILLIFISGIRLNIESPMTQNMVSIETEFLGPSAGKNEISVKKEATRRAPRKQVKVLQQRSSQKVSASVKVRNKTYANGTPVLNQKSLVSALQKKEMETKLSNERAQKEKINKELNQVAGDIDKALDESDGGQPSTGAQNGPGGNDPLGDAGWSLKPRRTVYFPNIQSKIPAKYKKKGMSYATTAKIVFDKNGIAAKVDIITSSGDPNIDSIFFTELKKVRVEPISENRMDQITKRFSISLR